MTDRGRQVETTDPVLKRVDAWWTVLVVDPVAVQLARRSREVRWISPIRLTATAHVLGVVSAVLFALGWLIPAALLFEVRFVLDCADGKLARLRGSSSAAGAFLDYVGDYLVVGANVAALAAWAQHESAFPAWAGIATGVAYLAHIAAGQAAARQADLAGTPVALFSETMPGGYRGWMARRRLKPLPSRIEAEHGLLFVLPLVTAVSRSTVPVEVGLWMALGYFGAQTVHITRLAWKVALASDRAVGEGP